MSRGALAWAALTVAGLFVAVLFNRPIEQTPSAGGRSASERLRVAPGSFAPLVPEDAEPEQSEEAQTPDQPAAPVTAVQVFLLLGGLVGADGTLTSAGMFHLASMLRALPDTTVTTYSWNNWPDAYRAILANQGKAKIVVIGYSGGGSRATWLANMPSKPKIDLMVHYDPSPRWQMKPIGINVKKALCYHNTQPLMWVPGHRLAWRRRTRGQRHRRRRARHARDRDRRHRRAAFSRAGRSIAASTHRGGSAFAAWPAGGAGRAKFELVGAISAGDATSRHGARTSGS